MAASFAADGIAWRQRAQFAIRRSGNIYKTHNDNDNDNDNDNNYNNNNNNNNNNNSDMEMSNMRDGDTIKLQSEDSRRCMITSLSSQTKKLHCNIGFP